MKKKVIPSSPQKPSNHRIRRLFQFSNQIVNQNLGMELGEFRPYKAAILRNGKRPFIEFWAFDESINDLRKKQLVCPVEQRNRLQSWAKIEIKKINDLLKEGYHFKAEKIEVKTNKDSFLVDEISNIMKIKKLELKKKSYQTYVSGLNRFYDFLAEHKMMKLRISQLDKNIAYKYSNHLVLKGYSSRTVNNSIELAKSVINRIKDSGVKIKRFKTKKVKEVETESNKAFEPEHLKIILDYISEFEPEFYILTQVMYHTFIRPKELRSIKISYVDLDSKQINVSGEISKNSKREFVQLNDVIIEILQKYMNGKDRGLYLFGNKISSGNKMASDNCFYNKSRKILEHLDLFKFGYTLYSWKHTGVCAAFNSGLNIKQLQRLLRHSSIEMTDIYLKSLNLNCYKEVLKGW